MTPPRPVVVFDLDGVVFDSAELIARCTDEVLIERGLAPLSAAERRAIIGPPLLTGFRELLDGRGLDAVVAPSLVTAFRAVYGPIAAERTPTFPGVPDVLERLSEGARLGVATSKLETFAKAILERLDLINVFSVVVGTVAGRPEEPKTETLRRALVALGADGAATMVGDRRHDVIAARANGVRAIGVTWGVGTRAELEEAGADVVIDEPAQLLALVVAPEGRS